MRFSTTIYPENAVQALELAVAACDRFFGDVPYEIVDVDISTRLFVNAEVAWYEATVEAVGS